MNEHYLYHYKQDPHDAARNKEKILHLIEQDKQKYNIQLNKQGYWYDYPTCGERESSYEDTALKIITPFVKNTAKEFGCKILRLPPVWFQQYPAGAKFGWHTHPKSHFACVYFVELPDPQYATEFLTLGRFPVNEGDIILFPSFLPHRSPYINTDQRKTILSTNFDFNAKRS